MSGLVPIRTVVCRRDPATSRKLQHQNAPERGLLVLTGTPANQGLAPITRALLEAMGKDPQLTGGATCSTRYGWPLLPPWLLALGISEVVVDEAQLLPPKVLEELIVLVLGLGIRLWLVAHRPLGDTFPAVLAAWPTEEASTENLRHVLTRADDAPAGAATEPEVASYPSVPSSEFLLFRAHCRDLLSPDDFALVDDRYLRAAAETREWLKASDHPIHAEAVARELRSVLLDCGSPEEMLTVLRAAAAVLLLADVLLTCDAAGFMASVVDQDWYLVRRHPDWRALGGYRQPYRAAVCAMAAGGLSLEQIVALTCSDVDAAGIWVTPGHGRRITVPAGGVAHVRAQLLSRKAWGAEATDLLFLTAEGAPASVRYLREALTEPTVEAGVELSSGRVSRRRPTPMQWATRLGIRIQSLT